MSRDISKAIENYKKHFWHDNPHNAGCFMPRDIEQIMEMSASSTAEAAHNGLMAGFWIGYQYGRRQEARKRRSENEKPDFPLWCALKYIAAAGKRDHEEMSEDLKKAVWYIERYIEKNSQDK